MAEANYTVDIHDSFNRLQDDLRALSHLVLVTPREDEHWPVLNLIDSALEHRFEELQTLVVKQLTQSDS